jgi:hypothetical protein
MLSIPKPNLFNKGRRHHRQQMAIYSDLPALVPGAGEILANGHLRVAFPAVDGSTIVYGVTTEVIYRFHREPLCEPAKAVAAPPVTEAYQAKHHVDALLRLLADLDGRVARVAKSKVTISDIVANLNMAAE